MIDNFIKDCSKMKFETHSIVLEKEIWEEYSELVKKTNINKNIINTMMFKKFIDELKEELKED